MAEQFSVPVTVRGYETDMQGHLNQSVYLQYAEHARWAMLHAAGISQTELIGKGVGPVVLETNIRYLRELRAGDEVEVTCGFAWGEGKSFRVEQTTDGWMLYPQDNSLRPLAAHKTPSGGRAERNLLAALRRAGLRWPPTKG